MGGESEGKGVGGGNEIPWLGSGGGGNRPIRHFVPFFGPRS